MRKEFTVAGLTFGVCMPDDHRLWALMGQYSPFRQDCAPGEPPVFTLEVVDRLDVPDIEVAFDQPTEPGEARITLYRTSSRDGRWYVETAISSEHPIAGKLLTDSGFTRGELEISAGGSAQALFALNNALMLMYAFRTSCMGVLEMHASVIKQEGRGYLFIASSGTGKSTHSSLWLKHIPGSTLLNDDNPIVRVLPDGSAHVYGSPWSGKTPCYRNDSCPIGAIVKIRRCTENRITRLDTLEAYAEIYGACSGFKADDRMADGLHESIAAIACGLPVFVLDCRPDEQAARVCYAGVNAE